MDVSGVVEAVGAEVTRLKVGDAVLAYRLAGFAVLNWVDDAAMMALMFC